MNLLKESVYLSNLRYNDSEPEFDLIPLGGEEFSTGLTIEISRAISRVIQPEGNLENFLKKYVDEQDYIGPFSFENRQIVFWSKDSKVSALVTDLLGDISWIIQSISYHMAFEMKITSQSVLDLRYKYPVICAMDPKLRNFKLQDAFKSIPQTYFKSILNGDPFENYEDNEYADILNVMNNILKGIATDHPKELEKNLRSALELLLMSRGSKERFYIAINLMDALLFSKIDRSMLSNIFIDIFSDQIEYLNLQGMKNITWVISCYLKYYFGAEVELEKMELNNYEVPMVYYLLPNLSRIRQERIENIAEFLNDLNNEALEIGHFLYGQGYLYESIGYVSAAEKNYHRAVTFFTLAVDYYNVIGSKTDAIICNKKSVQSSIYHYSEYATAANLFHYIGQQGEGIKMAWMALNISMSIVKNALGISMSYTQDILDSVIEYIDQCRRPLLAEESDMTPVVDLKISELENFYRSLLYAEDSEENLSDAVTSIEMHQESIKFLMPFTPPIFLFLTTDGRLIYSVKATEELEMEETHLTHLLAGVLTAVRSMFVEASFSSSGTVKEINTGDSTLLIEARESIVVVTSALNMTQEIRNFTLEIANILEEQFSDIIVNWDGEVAALDPMVDLINKKILSVLVG